MGVNEKLTAIADAIRSRTGGTQPLTLDQMAKEIGEISATDGAVVGFRQMNGLVEDYLDEADRKYTEENGGTLSVIPAYLGVTPVLEEVTLQLDEYGVYAADEPDFAPFSLVDGKEYRVSVDGVAYTCTACTRYDDTAETDLHILEVPGVFELEFDYSDDMDWFTVFFTFYEWGAGRVPLAIGCVGLDGADSPLGYPIEAGAGTLYLQNEDSGQGWMQSLDGGKHTIYHAIPEEVTRYLVRNSEGESVESGRIKPYGRVRMLLPGGGVRNCRDLGGWECERGTVRYGRLFRAAVPGGVQAGAWDAKDLNIRRHIELRSDGETAGTAGSCLGAGVRYQHLPITAGYAACLRTESADYENVRLALGSIMDGIIHGENVLCSSSLGRDRTETVIFMLLALLDVTAADIDKDYELSSLFTADEPALRTDGDYRGLAEYLTALGGSLREGAVRWFTEAGFGLEELNAFRTAMIHGSPQELIASES